MLTEVPAESPEIPLPVSEEAETVTSADENDGNGQEIKTPAVPLVTVTDVPQKHGCSWGALAVRIAVVLNIWVTLFLVTSGWRPWT